MALETGTKLGPYQIAAQIGAGGMGEVYRATDTRLDRTVAIKVLPEHLAGDPQRRERFEREAKAVSSLNHPHICTLHDVGEQDGIHYLVMELVEGETLAASLTRGPLPVGEGLRCAAQIADALDKAHRQGITHRDLKPGNVMLTKVGAKLLDFGLAKLKRGPLGESALPTQLASVTAEGTILGTLQYMAPEQLEGREADARSDIFAFGAMLYEMVTGRKAFEGTSQASLISAILRDQPQPMSALQPVTPAALDRIVRTCLAKDPDERWQSATDLGRELRWIGEEQSHTTAQVSGMAVHSQPGEPGPSAAQVPSALASKRQLSGWVVAFVAGAALTGVLMWTLPGEESEPLALRQWQATFDGSADHPALSPDGERLAYQVTRCSVAGKCWAEVEWQDLSAGDPIPIELTVDDGGQAVPPIWFWDIEWSLDGRELLGAAGFEDERLNGVYEISLSGALTRLAQGTVTSVTYRPGTKIVDWIMFPEGLQSKIQAPIWQSLDLATQEIENRPLPFPATDLRWTSDARWLALSRGSGDWLAGGESNVAILSATGEVRDVAVIPGPPVWSRARWNAEGTLLYLASRGRLVGIEVDPETGMFSGEPEEFIDTLQPPGRFDFEFDASDGGRGAYVRYDFRTDLRLLTLTGAQGMDIRSVDSSTGFKGYPALSPDGRDVAYVKQDLLGVNVYLQSIAGDAPRRVTRTESFKRHPVWSPDGQLLAFVDNGEVGMTLFVVGRNGERPRPVGSLSGLSLAQAFGWSPDSRFVVYTAGGAVWQAGIDGGEQKLLELPQPITNAWGLAVSPNGTTIALLSQYYSGGKNNLFRIHIAGISDPEAGWTKQFEVGRNEWLTSGVEARRSPFDRWNLLTLLPWQDSAVLDVGHSSVEGNREFTAIWRVTLDRGTAERVANLAGHCSGGIASVSATSDLSKIVCPQIDASRDIWIVDRLDRRAVR